MRFVIIAISLLVCLAVVHSKPYRSNKLEIFKRLLQEVDHQNKISNYGRRGHHKRHFSPQCPGADDFCDGGSTCLDDDQFCDGEDDCTDGFDEDYCAACGHKHDWCDEQPDKTATCLTEDQMCDGNADCNDGYDEDPHHCDCHETCDADTVCLDEDQFCDGEADCVDEFDEKYCAACNHMDDWCDEDPATGSATCLDEDQLCDGTADCLDGYDEEEQHCEDRKRYLKMKREKKEKLVERELADALAKILLEEE